MALKPRSAMCVTSASHVVRSGGHNAGGKGGHLSTRDLRDAREQPVRDGANDIRIKSLHVRPYQLDGQLAAAERVPARW